MLDLERISELLSDFGTFESFKELEIAREPLLAERCRLQKEYYQAKEKMRVPKDKEVTDFDRTIMNNAYCAEIQEEYEYIKGLEELVAERIQLLREIQSDGRKNASK